MVVVPLMMVMSLNFAGIGAAATWVLLNLGQILILPAIIHHRILRGELMRWFLYDVGIPVVVTLVVVGTGRWLLVEKLTIVHSAITFLAVIAIAFGSVVLVAREMRTWMVVNFGVYIKKLRSV